MAYFNGPRIVTDGLVLCLDAASSKSYPGSGDTWYDLSNRKNNAQLFNSPSVSSNFFSFNGIDSYGVISSNLKTIIEDSSEFTLLSLANIKEIEHVDNLVGWGNANSDGGGVVRTFGFYARNSDLQAMYNHTAQFGGSDLLDKWIFYVSRYTLTNVYANCYGGVVRANSGSVTGGKTWKEISTSYPITISKTSYFSRYMHADISLIQGYNRFLSDEEVLQNFNAIKGRFNL